MSPADLGFLVAPCLAFIVAAGSPGPATLATAATAMARGRRDALVLGIGLALGLTLWGVVAAAGLGALMLASVTAMTILRIAGGAYLLYLAWLSARSAVSGGAAIAYAPGGRGLFRRGLILNAMNPKAVLAWTAVIALGLPSGAGAVHLWTIVAACSGLGVVVYAVYAVAFSLAPMRSGYARAQRGIEAILALAFGAAGLRLMTSRTETP